MLHCKATLSKTASPVTFAHIVLLYVGYIAEEGEEKLGESRLAATASPHEVTFQSAVKEISKGLFCLHIKLIGYQSKDIDYRATISFSFSNLRQMKILNLQCHSVIESILLAKLYCTR